MPRSRHRYFRRSMLLLAAAGLLYGVTAEAAQCKVNGRWYPYTSPQCTGNAAPDEPADSVPGPAAGGRSADAEPSRPVMPPRPGSGPGDQEIREIVRTTRRVTQLALAKGKECELALTSPDGREKCAQFAKFVDEELTPWQQRCLEIPVGGMAGAGVSSTDLNAMRRDSRLLKALLEKVKSGRS